MVATVEAKTLLAAGSATVVTSGAALTSTCSFVLDVTGSGKQINVNKMFTVLLAYC